MTLWLMEWMPNKWYLRSKKNKTISGIFLSSSILSAEEWAINYASSWLGCNIVIGIKKDRMKVHGPYLKRLRTPYSLETELE